MKEEMITDLLLSDLKIPLYENNPDITKVDYLRIEGEYLDYVKYENFDRLMNFYEDKNRMHLEKYCYGFINSVFDWNSKYFDVINSFWTVFKYALLNTDEMFGYWKSKDGNEYPIIVDGKDCLNAEEFAYRYVNGLFNEAYMNKIKQCLDIFPGLNILAGLCHCYANFMPCPDNLFNISKGVSNCSDNMTDFMYYLRYDKPLYYKKNNDILLITDEYRDKWNNYLLNSDNLFLQDYFGIEDNEFFYNFGTTQECLKNNLHDYLFSVINAILKRAGRMTDYMMNKQDQNFE